MSMCHALNNKKVNRLHFFFFHFRSLDGAHVGMGVDIRNLERGPSLFHSIFVVSVSRFFARELTMRAWTHHALAMYVTMHGMGLRRQHFFGFVETAVLVYHSQCVGTQHTCILMHGTSFFDLENRLRPAARAAFR